MTAADGRRAPFAGVDIGGTATRVVAWDNGGALGSRSVATLSFAAMAPAERIDRLAGIIAELLPPGVTPAAIGIGASGPVDVARGLIDNPYTLPAFSGLPIVAALEGRMGCPVIIDSDAVVAAVAEHQLGAGRGAARMLMVTLGTGIGVSLLVDGLPFRGGGGAHPEGGHIPIVSGTARCYCGITGCWEHLASRAALQERLRPLLPDDTPPDRVLGDAAAAAPASRAIRREFRRYGRLVGRGLCTLQTVYMPDVTVLGGSAATHLDLFGDGMARELARDPAFIAPVPVRVAALGEAGAIGAALLAARHLDARARAGTAAAPAR